MSGFNFNWAKEESIWIPQEHQSVPSNRNVSLLNCCTMTFLFTTERQSQEAICHTDILNTPIVSLHTDFACYVFRPQSWRLWASLDSRQIYASCNPSWLHRLPLEAWSSSVSFCPPSPPTPSHDSPWQLKRQPLNTDGNLRSGSGCAVGQPLGGEYTIRSPGGWVLFIAVQ